MNVLLVEPNYKNKYPPMGLMKISTYHKNRNDSVWYFKGKMPEAQLAQLNIDRVYITTLFTFYYQRSVETIKYYCKRISPNQVYVGGIMATLMSDKLQADVAGCNILTGQLTDAAILGFEDHTNIDSLPLDYSILDEISYDYPAGDNYISYTTRGCPNHCSFCAVPILEPNYQFTNNIREQLHNVNTRFGEKRNLLLLDNNIFNLSVGELQELVSDLHAVGFTQKPTFYKHSPYDTYLAKRGNPHLHPKVLQKAIDYLNSLNTKIKNEDDKATFNQILRELSLSSDKGFYLSNEADTILAILHRNIHSRPLKRYIDFNQGLEAARITPEKMKVLSQLPLKPVRIAFDHYTPRSVENYRRAIRIAHEYGINNFSNYMLFNFDDTPDALWYRLKINIDLAQELHVSIFSFPMKYMPITRTDRKYIGPHWNIKYLQAISAVLNVTKGVVAQGSTFFNRAFGSNLDEYHRILLLPRDFIIYRSYYEEQGLTAQWDHLYQQMSDNDKAELLNVLTNSNYITTNKLVLDIIPFYDKAYEYKELKKRG